jgi:riboflavin synthase alpha subunit
MLDTAATTRERREQSSTDIKTLQRLRHSVRLALERYLDLAGRSSGHLVAMAPGSLDDIARTNLAILQRKEDQAYQFYLNARSALMDYIDGGYSGRTGKACG